MLQDAVTKITVSSLKPPTHSIPVCICLILTLSKCKIIFGRGTLNIMLLTQLETDFRIQYKLCLDMYI